MTFIIKQEDILDFSPDFQERAEIASELQKEYTASKENAQLKRMELIGMWEQYKALFPQRSSEHKYIQQGYADNGWSPDTVSKNSKAWHFKQRLLGKGDEIFTNLAEAATYTQLYELSRNESQNTTIYCAAKYLQKTGKVPSKTMIKGHAGGFFTDDFVSKSSLRKTEESATAEKDTKVTEESTTTEVTEAEVTSQDPEVTEESATVVIEETVTSEPQAQVEPPKVTDKSATTAAVTEVASVVIEETIIEDTEPCKTAGIQPLIDVSPTVDEDSNLPEDLLIGRSPSEVYKAMESYVFKYRSSWSIEDKKKMDMAADLIKAFIGTSPIRR